MAWYYWLIVLILAGFSFFFSMADMVYSLADQDKLSHVKGKNEKKAKIAIKLSEDYEMSVSSILFGNNIVNIFMSSIVTIIGMSLNPSHPDLGATIATAILTVLVIIFSEFLPKAIAKRFSFRLSIALAYPTQFFKYLTYIFVWPISRLFILIGKLFTKRSKEEDEINEDVLEEMVDSIEKSGLIEEGEADLVRNTLDLSDIQAYEIMTPRVDVLSIDINDDINEILKKEDLFKFSRIPLYEETIDNIIGILPVKELGKMIIEHKENIDLLSLCYKPIFIPRHYQILDLLAEFKEKKTYIAIVKDEYGGTEGIVTMEDILEEIVGDIYDEADESEKEYVDEGNGLYIVDGSMNIEDFFELINYKEEYETDYSTVGGLCQELLDRFAVKGDEFDFAHYHITILAADEFTVEKIKVLDLGFEENNNEED